MHADQALLLEMIDSAYNRKGWHGTTLSGSLRGLQPDVALWRPAPDRRNVWEVAVHAAYWKYVVWRRLTGNKRGSFALKGSNWFPSPEVADIPALVQLLDSEHERLRAAIAALPALPASGPKRAMLHGIAAHDLYHTGQIQLLKRLSSESPES